MNSVSAPPGKRQLWYLCLEALVEGQARYAHVTEIARGLSARGWITQIWSPPRRDRPRGALRRLLDMVNVQARILMQLGRPEVLYVRGHFASLPSVLWARVRSVPVVWESNGP